MSSDSCVALRSILIHQISNSMSLRSLSSSVYNTSTNCFHTSLDTVILFLHFFAVGSPIIVVQPAYVNKCFTKRKEVSFFYRVGDGKLLSCCVTLECTSSQLALELVSVLPCVVVRVLWKPPQIL